MTEHDAMGSIDDQFIDRIVDGEMTPTELRPAIDRLDRLPDGWKRCALAFLEAECWRESLRGMGQSASARTEGRSLFMAPPAATRGRWIRGPIAAGIVVASFAMGWLGHAGRPWSALDTTALVSSKAISESPASGSQAERPAEMTHVSAQKPTPRESPPTLNEVIRAVGRLRLGPENTGPEVPILAGPGINEQWLRNQPPPLTEYGQVALQQHGYQVDQSRRLVTTTLADGRRVTIPIDQVQIRYTGNNPL